MADDEIITIQKVTIDRSVNWPNLVLLVLAVCAVIGVLVVAFRKFRS
jgi:hypothetical protein